MSLFEDDNYQYIDTYFVYFNDENCPTEKAVVDALSSGSEKYELTNIRAQDGDFRSITVRSPHDSSGLDITYVQGEEVVEQIEELMTEFRQISLEGDDFAKLKMIGQANARLDVFQFERVSDSPGQEMIDPGGLFLVMGKLNQITEGVGLDPQSKTLI